VGITIAVTVFAGWRYWQTEKVEIRRNKGG
jgi:predicted negative regulator of RcsB-dependent stress response